VVAHDAVSGLQQQRAILGHAPRAARDRLSIGQHQAHRLILVGVQNSSAFARPFALAPGTPKDRVATLRKAFQATLTDPAFMAEAQKANLALDPVTGDEMARLVADVFTLDAALVEKLKQALLQ